MQICMPFFDDFMQLGVLGRFFMRSLFACRVACLFLSGSIFVADDEDYRAIRRRCTLPMVAQWMITSFGDHRKHFLNKRLYVYQVHMHAAMSEVV